jgi:hypothetical protein
MEAAAVLQRCLQAVQSTFLAIARELRGVTDMSGSESGSVSGSTSDTMISAPDNGINTNSSGEDRGGLKRKAGAGGAATSAQLFIPPALSSLGPGPVPVSGLVPESLSSGPLNPPSQRATLPGSWKQALIHFQRAVSGPGPPPPSLVPHFFLDLPTCFLMYDAFAKSRVHLLLIPKVLHSSPTSASASPDPRPQLSNGDPSPHPRRPSWLRARWTTSHPRSICTP